MKNDLTHQKNISPVKSLVTHYGARPSKRSEELKAIQFLEVRAFGLGTGPKHRVFRKELVRMEVRDHT